MSSCTRFFYSNSQKDSLKKRKMIRRNKFEKLFDFGNYFLINSFRYVLEMRAIFGRDFLLYLVCRMNNKNCRGCLTFFCSKKRKWWWNGDSIISFYGRIFFCKKKSVLVDKRRGDISSRKNIPTIVKQPHLQKRGKHLPCVGRVV